MSNLKKPSAPSWSPPPPGGVFSARMTPLSQSPPTLGSLAARGPLALGHGSAGNPAAITDAAALVDDGGVWNASTGELEPTDDGRAYQSMLDGQPWLALLVYASAGASLGWYLGGSRGALAGALAGGATRALTTGTLP